MKMIVALGVGALFAAWPLVATAQSDAPAQPVQVAQATTSGHAAGGGSHSKRQRHRANQSRERAREGAEHRRQRRHAPSAPKS